MTDLDRAIAAAREALAKRDELAHRGNRLRAEERANWECAQHLRVILAALDAARGEAVATVQTITSLVGETRKCIVGALEVIDSLPVNTAVYAAPPNSPRVERYGDGVLVHWPEGVEQYVAVGDCVTAPSAAAVPPERDWTMIQSGDASIPAWVVHYANAIGAYMKAQNVQHWAVGPVQSRNEAQQPALAVPADGMLPDALAPHAKEWYRLCERRFAVDRITISGKLAEAIVAAISTQAPPAAVVPEGLTPRHWRVIDFALWRFINDAYDRATAAAQDKEGRWFKPGSHKSFFADAKDAEDARGIVMDHAAMLAADNKESTNG